MTTVVRTCVLCVYYAGALACGTVDFSCIEKLGVAFPCVRNDIHSEIKVYTYTFIHKTQHVRVTGSLNAIEIHCVVPQLCAMCILVVTPVHALCDCC